MPPVASFVIDWWGRLNGHVCTIRFAAAGVMGFGVAFAFAAAISLLAIFLAMISSPLARD